MLQKPHGGGCKASLLRDGGPVQASPRPARTLPLVQLRGLTQWGAEGKSILPSRRQNGPRLGSAWPTRNHGSCGQNLRAAFRERTIYFAGPAILGRTSCIHSCGYQPSQRLRWMQAAVNGPRQPLRVLLGQLLRSFCAPGPRSFLDLLRWDMMFAWENLLGRFQLPDFSPAGPCCGKSTSPPTS